MEKIISIIEYLVSIGDFLWGMPMLTGLFLVSLLYTIGNKGFQFTHFGHVLKNTFGKQLFGAKASGAGISSFKAFCTALCNTLGVGNIAGVGLAIAMGGPGAVFWIWVADFLALSLKYGEITLGVKYREIDPQTKMYHGGIMWYIEKGLGRRWKWIAVIYAACYALTVVNVPAVQINTMASSITTYFDIPPVLIGVAAALLMALVLLGGLKSVSSFAEMVVPFMAGIYFIATLFVLLSHASSIPAAFADIFRYAVSDVEAVTGGFMGASVAMAVRFGMARGFYSNGAGIGDAPFVHSSADVSHPSEQGIWGISEVFVDCIVCTCTALAIIVTGAWKTGESGVALTAKAFSISFGSDAMGSLFISIIVAFFAFTTAVVGVYFGEICLKYFTSKRWVCIVYRIILCGMAVFGTNEVFVSKVDLLWRLGDFDLSIIIMLSLLVLILLRKEVFACTEEYKQQIKDGIYSKEK